MEEKSFASAVKSIEDRTVTGIAAVFGNIDLVGDRIHKGAFKKTITENSRHIRHLWQHNYNLPPIARIDEIAEVGKADLPDQIRAEFPEATGGLQVKRTYLNTERGNEVLEALKTGALNEMSFGFDVVKFDISEETESADEKSRLLVRNIREVKLWDISDVNWGANPATAGVKAVVPYKDTGQSNDKWAAPNLGDFADAGWAELSDAEKTRIANHYAWAETLPPENFGQLKLPHHKPSKDSIGPAVWNGVSAAMAALFGARGGVNIPESEMKGVYNHLAKHYAEFDKEPPEFSSLMAVRSIIRYDITPLIKGYYVNGYEIVPLVTELRQRLAEAEPQVVEFNPALTSLVMRKLKVLEQELDIL